MDFKAFFLQASSSSQSQKKKKTGSIGEQIGKVDGEDFLKEPFPRGQRSFL